MWTTGTFSVVEFSENYLQTHHRIDHHSVKRSSSDCDLEVKKVSTPAFPQVHCVSCLCGPVDWRHYPLHDPYCQREYMAYGTFPLPGLTLKGRCDVCLYFENLDSGCIPPYCHPNPLTRIPNSSVTFFFRHKKAGSRSWGMPWVPMGTHASCPNKKLGHFLIALMHGSHGLSAQTSST